MIIFNKENTLRISSTNSLILNVLLVWSLICSVGPHREKLFIVFTPQDETNQIAFALNSIKQEISFPISSGAVFKFLVGMLAFV